MIKKRFGKIFLIWPLLLSFGVSAGEIKGVVTDSETKKPVGGALINARSAAHPEGANALSEEDGTYTIHDLAAGSYTVTANFAGATAEKSVEVKDKGSVELALAVAMSKASVATYNITGTRIRVPNATALSPVTSVSSSDIMQRGSTSIETVVNTLPQAFAAQGSTLSNGASGTGEINLRGLGRARNIVLLDGKRLGPGNPDSFTGTTDINFIPAQLIERIDVLTGGASAVYGADAVAGVTNFVTKKNFEGVQLDVQWSTFQHGQQNKTLQDMIKAKQDTITDPILKAGYAVPKDVWNVMGPSVALTMGVNSPDGKGNVTAYGTYRKDYAVYQSDRDFTTCALNSSNTAFSCGGSSNTSPPRVFINPQNPDLDGDGFPIEDDVVVVGNDFADWDNSHLYNFAPLNFLQRPDERYNLGAFAHYELAKWADVYSQAMYMNDDSLAQIAPSGTFFTPARISCDNPFLSPAQRARACPNGSTYFDSFIGKRNVEGGPRIFDLAHSSFRYLMGVKGEIAKNWNYDVYMSYMSTDSLGRGENDFNSRNVAKALNVVPDNRPTIGGNPNPNFGQPICASVLDGTDLDCVPYNVWEPDEVTQEALNYLQATSLVGGNASERIVDLSVSADLGGYGVKSPLACDGVAFSVGGEWRRAHIKTFSDYLSTNGFFTGSGGKTTNIDNGFDVYEAFGEVRIPVIQDYIAFTQLALEGAYRYSNYSFGKDTHTFKAGADWEFVPEMRVRGSYQRAVRAPNLGELYGPVNVVLDGATDPCALAGSGLAANDPQVLACQAAFPNINPLAVVENPASQYNGKVGGNTNLNPEVSDTFSVGFVAEPTFIPGLTLSVDYFNIKVNKAIGVIGADLILQNCIDSGDPTGSWCSLVHRDASGSLWRTPNGFIDDRLFNLGSDSTSGIDFLVNYALPFKRLGLENMGTLTLNFNGTWLAQLISQPLEGGASYDCVGLYGTVCGTSKPAWRHKMRLSWDAPFGLSISGQWRYVSTVSLDAMNSQAELNNPSLVRETDKYLGSRNYLDLFASYQFLKMFSVSVGVNNVIDTDPPLTGNRNCGAAGQCNGNTYPQVYDALGRYFFVHGTAKF